MHQFDVTTAFLNGKFEEEVYMKQSQGFILKEQEELVCRLNKSIYGLIKAIFTMLKPCITQKA